LPGFLPKAAKREKSYYSNAAAAAAQLRIEIIVSKNT